MKQTEGEKVMDSIVGSWEAFDPFIEAAAGFRERCKRGGWSDHAAEAMALMYFQSLMASALSSLGKGTAAS